MSSPETGLLFIYYILNNGTRLKSLGVLEHWNNATDKKYSRNLGKTSELSLFIFR